MDHKEERGIRGGLEAGDKGRGGVDGKEEQLQEQCSGKKKIRNLS